MPRWDDQKPVAEEIRRVVARAIRDRSTLETGRIASDIAHSFPTCGLNTAQIAEQLIEAAVHAGVSLELSTR
jgi:hypothetical protein